MYTSCLFLQTLRKTQHTAGGRYPASEQLTVFSRFAGWYGVLFTYIPVLLPCPPVQFQQNLLEIRPPMRLFFRFILGNRKVTQQECGSNQRNHQDEIWIQIKFRFGLLIYLRTQGPDRPGADDNFKRSPKETMCLLQLEANTGLSLLKAVPRI